MRQLKWEDANSRIASCQYNPRYNQRCGIVGLTSRDGICGKAGQGWAWLGNARSKNGKAQTLVWAAPLTGDKGNFRIPESIRGVKS